MINKLFKYYSNRFISRWLVLGIDIFLALAAFIIAYLLRFNFDFKEENFVYMDDQFLLIFFFFILGSMFSGSYSGIIRHSSLNDAYRVLKGVGFGSIVLFSFSFFVQNVQPYSEFNVPKSIVIIHFLLTSFFQIIFRFAVKFVFNLFNSKSYETKKVMIFGAGASGMMTKNTLLADRQIRYQVLGFIDDNDYKTSKTLDGVAVYSPKKIDADWLKNHQVDELIISVQRITPERKNEIVDLCLDAGVLVKSVPSIKKWINGELSSKQIKNVKIEDLLERAVIELNNQKVVESIQNKVVLITGAAGSIGSEIARQCLELKPAILLLLDQAETPLHNLELELRLHKNFSITNVEFIIGDIGNYGRMELIFSKFKPDIVYHAAAYKHVPMMESNPAEAVSVNVLGTKIIADLSIIFKTKKFVMVSTDKAVNPTNIMGTSKRIAEIYTQALQQNQDYTKFVITRFGNVLGSNGSVIPLFKKQIEEGGPITVTHRDITRYFMTIPEACQLVLEAGTMGLGGEIFVFDMGQSVKVYDIALKMIKLSGLQFQKDIDIKIIGLRPGEKLYEELLNNKENTIPTHHPKIMIGKVNAYPFTLINSQVNELKETLKLNDNFKLVALMKKIVPEFISQNSVFSEIDKK